MISATAEVGKGIVMGIDMKVILSTISHMVQEFIFGQMVRFMKENGLWVLSMVRASGKAFLVIAI